MPTPSGQTDSVRLPLSVRRQYKRALDLEKEQTAADEAAAATDASTPPPAAAPAPTPPAAAPAAAPAVAPAPAPAAANGEDPRASDPSYWRHRFQTTQGLWENDRKRFDAAAESNRSELAVLRAKVSELESRPTTGAPAAVDLSTFMTAEQIEAIGEDQAQLIVSQAQRTARAEVEKIVAREIKPIQEQRTRDIEEAQARARTTFFEKLTEMTPNWQEINTSPEWLSYLKGRDETTKIGRQAIIHNAQAEGDPEPIHLLLQGFIKSQNASAPPPPPSPQPQGGAGGVTGDAPAAAPQPEITKDFITKFYTDRAIGRYKGAKEKEGDAIAARINAAHEAGLIRR